MLPLAIVAGMPLNKAREFRVRISNIAPPEGWNLEWVPSRTHRAELKGIWDHVTDLANNADAAGVHILAYHKQGSDRKNYPRQIRYRHRLAWLCISCLYGQDGGDWWLDIEERLRLEGAWRESVRPDHHNHPLILPSESFASTLDPWTVAQRAGSERRISRARAAVDQFLSRHRHPEGWKDDRDLIFDAGGPPHGQAPQDRRWKFTRKLPPGFHFDVKHEQGRRFRLRTAGGETGFFDHYTNVDAHGHVRGGR